MRLVLKRYRRASPPGLAALRSRWLPGGIIRLLEVNRGSCRRLVTRRVFLPVALRERRRVPRVHGKRTRLRWLAGLRNPYARRASSLASRFRLSETEIRDSGQERGDDFVCDRDTVLARDSSSGMSSFCAHQS